MPTIQFSTCEGCPYRRDTDLDWDLKSMPHCSKAGRDLSTVRVDLRWDRGSIQALPKWCPLEAPAA